MEVLLSSTRSGSEKKKILEEEFGVAMSEELEREVLEVCNLSQGVRAEGREEGRQEGRIEGIGIGEISAESGFQWLECRPQLFEKQQPDTEPEFDTEQQKAVYWIKHFLVFCREKIGNLL